MAMNKWMSDVLDTNRALQEAQAPPISNPKAELISCPVAVPTCVIRSSAQDVEGGVQTLNQAEPSSDVLFAQYRVAAQQHFLDAATKRASKVRVVPHRFYQ